MRPAARRGPTAPRVLPAYLWGTGLLGLGLTVLLWWAEPPLLLLLAVPVPVLVVLGLLVLGELLPIPVARGDATTSRVSMSTTFAVALVVCGPVAPVLLLHLSAVLLDDLRSGRRPARVVFDLGQHALSMLAARAVFAWLSGAGPAGPYQPFEADQLAPALLAGMVYAGVDHLLVGGAVALRTGQPLLRTLGEDLRWTLETSTVLVGMAPVTALLLDRAPWMLLLVLLPMVAVRRSAQTAAASELQALRDPLTGLGNRTSLQQQLQLAARASSRSARVGMLLVDLDHFKDVNDSLGHDVGDRLLVQVAARLHDVAPEGAHVVRLGGDEFAVLVRAGAAEDAVREVEAAAGLVLDVLREPVDLGCTRLAVHGSIGVAVVEPSCTSDLLKHADIALYEAKGQRGRVAVYAAGADHVEMERITVLAGLAEAVRAGRLTVAYQPQVSCRTGLTRSYEALVRWDDPRFAHVQPATLVQLAENAGFIDAVFDQVLDRALGDLATWRAAGHDVGVGVNVSARQLSDEALPGRVAAALRRHGVPPARLTVEVTESSLMVDARRADVVMASLRALGVALSIDDFGTGYSSLVRLQQIDVDELKIDRAFVADLAGGATGETLLRTIVDLAANLGLEVVAEGVESEAVAARLAAMGCDRLQGYHLARPVPAGTALRLLQAEAREGWVPPSWGRPGGSPGRPDGRQAVLLTAS